MNNYELLLKFFEQKISNYKNTLSAKIIKKDELKTEINVLEEEINKKNTEAKNIEEEIKKIKTANDELYKKFKEFIIMGVFGIGVDFGISIVFAVISTQFTPSLLAHYMTFLITFLITTTISVTSEYYRTKKEIEPLKEIIENGNEFKLKSKKELLLSNIELLSEALKQKQENFYKRETTINRINEILINLTIKEYHLKNNYRELQKDLKDASDKDYNDHFNKDTHMREIMNLSRKKNNN